MKLIMEGEEKKDFVGTMIVPSIDMSKVQELANQFAMEGMRQALSEFYTGYNSPFKKAVVEHFNDQVPSYQLDLPGVMAMLNEALSSLCDKIVNQAIATTYIPLVKDLLTRSKDEVKVSEIVKKFIDVYAESDEWDGDNFKVSLEKDDRFDWYNLKLESVEDEVKLQITLHTADRLHEIDRYQILSMPIEEGYGYKFGRMKCTVTSEDGTNATLEMPYGHGILCNGFLRYIAKIVMFNTRIVLDQLDFYDIIYPGEDY